MPLLTVRARRAFRRLTFPMLSVLCAVTAALPLGVAAQCTLSSPPVSFEPNPPGLARPANLASGKSSDLQVFLAGGSSPHILMQEAFGYSILDLASPANPTALVYVNMAYTGEMPAVGDGQSYIASVGVSPDGARLALSLNGNADPAYGSAAASANGNGFNRITGGFLPRGAGGTIVQGVAGRYLAYSLIASSGIAPGALSVADITNIPGPLAPTNISSQQIGPGGSNLTLAGNNVLYLNQGTLRIYDASSPGPAGNIGGNFGLTTLGSGDFQGNRTPTSFSAAIDPTDSTKLWVLVELTSPLGYALVSVKSGVKTVNAQTFAVPQAGGGWIAGGVSALVPNGNGLFALMWAKKFGSPVVYRLFSTSVQGWGTAPGQLDLDSNSYPTFALNNSMRGLAGAGTALYAYIPTGNSAYVLPLSCISPNAPANASMAVTNQDGAALSDGATVFLGDQITIVPSINPPTGLQALTGFGWNFDFDFHAGAVSEDNGTGATPRIKAPDNGAFGIQAVPPALITVVGPCDYQVGGTSPGSGTGCWTSVTTNSAFGGPDFTSTPAVGSTTALAFAFEANNSLGSAGASTFTLNWKVPAVRLKSAQVLSGGSVDATGSDGHPSLGTGLYKWYFGSNPAAPAGETLALDPACLGPACPHAFPGTGTRRFNVWAMVPYPNGYVSADCPGLPTACQPATPLSVQVADFLPSFLVGGQSAPVVTVVPGATFNVTNQSQFGAVTGIQYSYSLCQDATGAAALCTTYLTMSFAGTLAPVPSPASPGPWYLRIRVAYTSAGQPTSIDWLPSIPGVSDPKAFPIVVSDCANPTFRINVDGGPQYPSPGFSVPSGSTIVFYPNNNYATYRWDFGDGSAIDTTQSPSHTYSGPGTHTVTFTANGSSGCVVSYQLVVTYTPPPTPLSAGATVSPNPANVGANVLFSCGGSGGAGGYTYTWTGAVTSSGQASLFQSFASPGSYQAQCNVRDAAGASAGAVVNLTVQAGGGSSCANTDFHITVDGGPQYPSPGFSVPSGSTIVFYPNNIYATYRWDFGDGSPTDTTQTPSHSYPSAGARTVSLTANGCTRTYQMVVTGPGGSGPGTNCATVDYSIRDVGTGLAACVSFGCNGITGQALAFTPSPAMTVPVTSWNFGDGTALSSANPGTHTYLNGGDYNVVLTAGTCTKTYQISIAGPSALSGAFLARYSDASSFVATQVASGKAINFLATDTADLYTWDFGDGSSPVTGQTPAHTFSEPFLVNRTVTLSVSRGTGTLAQNGSSTQTFTILPPPEPPKWFVAGMAYTQGAVSGTVWQSEVTILNPDPTRSGSYSVAFLDGRNPVSPASLVWKPLTIGAQKSLSSSNLLGEFFGQPLGSYGALLVRGDAAPVPPVITARTYNVGDPSKGTFGLSVPATQATSGVSQQSLAAQQLLIGLRDDASAYTNIGLVNLISTDWSHAHLTFFDAAGANLGVLNVDVPPYGVAQLSKPLTGGGWLNKPPSALFRVRVTVDPGGAVYPYATVIDQASTDPIVVTPTEQPLSSYRIPGIIRLSGAKGEQWRSRFTIENPSGAAARKVHMVFSYVSCDATGCGSLVSLPGDVIMNPGQTQSWDDFVKRWLTEKGHIPVDDVTRYQDSFLDVSPGDSNTDPLVVLGETYNDTPNGHIGLQVPGYTPLDGASRTGANKRLVLTGLASTAAYRSNLALFVVAGATGKWCSVHVYAATGEKLRDIPVFVDGFSQVNNGALFDGLPGSGVSVVIDGIDDGVTVAAYATIIDNTSGDATFVKAQPAP